MQADRNRLRELLRHKAILHSGVEQQLTDNRGHTLPWVYYNWGVALTTEGARLTGICLLDILQQFAATQLASYGLTSLPLVTTCVLLGESRYTGLAIREKPEKHGTCRQIDGVGNRQQPVIVVDDCICSGRSLQKAIAILEKEGYTVEGCVCVVDFPWRGGASWARAKGYRVETIFNVWDDLGIEVPPFVPAHQRISPSFDGNNQLCDGLTPAAVVRQMIEYYLHHGQLPTPPKELDTTYDGQGGIFISLRDRQTDRRIARDGFIYVKPSDGERSPDLALATYKLLLSSHEKISQYGLDKLKVGVSLLGEQEIVKPGELDFFQYGITIQSKVQPWKIGGALPNTQFFSSDMEQYLHSISNARLSPNEPYTIYRHEVVKSIESNSTWPPFGMSLHAQHSQHKRIPLVVGEKLTKLTRCILLALAANKTVPYEDLSTVIPVVIHGIGVSIYNKGIVGCWCAFSADPYDSLSRAASGAWNDDRYKISKKGADIDELQIIVTLLYDGEELGYIGSKQAAHKVRLGLDALVVHRKSQQASMLPFIPCHYDWGSEKMAYSLLAKAGIGENAKANWRTYNTTSWLEQKGEVSLLRKGYPVRKKAFVTKNNCLHRIEELKNFILKSYGTDELPRYCYWPVYDKWASSGTAARIIFAIQALGEAEKMAYNNENRGRALDSLDYICRYLQEKKSEVVLNCQNLKNGVGAECLLLLALLKTDNISTLSTAPVQLLIRKISSFMHVDGAISPHARGRTITDEHDILPGVVLVTLGELLLRGYSVGPINFDAYLIWYQRRFRTMHPWGMVWWHMQAWATIFRLTNQCRYADFVFELADWAIDHQLSTSGAFLVNYSTKGDDFYTACVLEGIADAWWVAKTLGDCQRTAKYATSWQAGCEFLDALIVQDEDTFSMHNPSFAVGGVRHSLNSSCLRIDFAAHTLIALLKGVDYGLVPE